MIDKLLLKHVGLPHILVLAVHLVNFFSWVSQGGHSEQLFFFALFYQSTPSCLKVRGGVVVVAHVILVSAQGPNPSFSFFGGLLFDLGACLDKGLDLDLDQGLTIFFKVTNSLFFLRTTCPDSGPPFMLGMDFR